MKKHRKNGASCTQPGHKVLCPRDSGFVDSHYCIPTIEDLLEDLPKSVPDDSSKAFKGPLGTFVHQVDRREERYLREYDLGAARVTHVRSACGTGKTFATFGKLRQVLKDAPGTTVLVIVARQRLAENAHRRYLAAMGFTFYQDGEAELKERRLVVCLDSLPRVSPYFIAEEGRTEIHEDDDGTPVFKSFDYVIIDESEQTLAHLAGATCQKNGLQRIWNALFDVLINARHIVCLDNDLGHITVRCIRRILAAIEQAKATTERFIENTYQLRRQATVYSDFLRCLEELLSLATGGRKVAVACAEKTKANTLAKMLRGLGIPVMCLNADNSGDTEPSRFMADPNAYVRDMKEGVIIFTPAIGTGVSVEEPVDAVFTMAAPGQHTSVPALFQMTNRFRQPGAYFFYVGPYFPDGRSRDCFRKSMLTVVHRGRRAVSMVLDKAPIQVDDDLFEHLVDVQYFLHQQRLAFPLQFVDYLTTKGFTVHHCTEQALSGRQLATAVKDVTERLKMRTAKSAATAAEIPPEQYLRLKAKPNRKTWDTHRLWRYELTTKLGREPTTEEMYAFLYGDMSGEIERFSDVRLFAEGGDALAWLDAADQARTNAGSRFRLQRGMIMCGLLKSFGIPNLNEPLTWSQHELSLDDDSRRFIADQAPMVRESVGVDAGTENFPEKPMRFVSNFLNKLGLKTVRRKIGSGQLRGQWAYQISHPSVVRMQELTAHYLEESRRKARKIAASGLAASRIDDIILPWKDAEIWRKRRRKRPKKKGSLRYSP